MSPAGSCPASRPVLQLWLVLKLVEPFLCLAPALRLPLSVRVTLRAASPQVLWLRARPVPPCQVWAGQRVEELEVSPAARVPGVWAQVHDL